MTHLTVRRSLGVGFVLATLLPATGSAQQGEQRAPPCSAPEYRQFDFWVGSWSVETPNGTAAGTNQITQIVGGCALKEEWTGAGGSRGTSYNMYDARTGQWHQTWVDNSGLLLVLDGGLEDGRMVLRGQKQLSDTLTVMHQISWEPIEDDRVVQRWNVSRDQGTSWQKVFEGTYTRQDRR